MATKAPSKDDSDAIYDGVTAVHNVVGESQHAVYVYEAPVRLWHWINAICITVLCVTGYLIGSPPESLSGEASSHSFFGTIRFLHFTAGQIMAVGFLARIYWAFAGNHHARQMFMVPWTSKAYWREVAFEGRWYLFLEKQPKKYLGHNPLAQLAMFTLFVIPAIVMIITGCALYAEGQGKSSWWYTAFGWVIGLVGNSFTVHTIHHLGMWALILFAIVHIYAAVREDIMSRQSIVSSMISGWRMFRND
jgi:Ni/Fe-hydrogenase 1 B-type cytochrome subunit